ncbi:hypothetical protein B7R54_04205 [Subtercola boreus]|uniref:Uncharacterized protein n=1 Tax=Subtercola boreus TaxID=120213 RepID=A0A3E0VFU4_9MICO|nr:hypothetical protein [Subtercola boreus]RFA08515.1 hypothetical protein B7R54_04205 [Subtercola boreus]
MSALAASGQLQGHDQTSDSQPLAFKSAWDLFVLQYVVPSQQPLLVASLTLLAFLILARLLVFAIKLPLRWLKDRVTRTLAGTVGLIVMIASAITFTLALGLSNFITASIVLVAGVVGAFCFATAMGSRLRLLIDVSSEGAPDASESAHIVALIADLGAAPARGLEAPVGSDVTALKDTALSVPSANAFVNVVMWILNTLFTTTPWHVTVDIGKDADVSVLLTRNTRARAAFIISADRIMPPDENRPVGQANALADHLLAFVASAIIVTLAEDYRGFEGLGGARNWQSVGLQYVASVNYLDKPDIQEALLTRALDLDPGNLPADVIYQFDRYEGTHTLADMSTYREWLKAQIEKVRIGPKWYKHVPHGQRDLYRRMLLNILVQSLNLQSMTSGNEKNILIVEAQDEAKALRRALTTRLNVTTPLTVRMRPAAGLMYAKARPSPFDIGQPPKTDHRTTTRWLREALLISSPNTAYNAACFYAELWNATLSVEEEEYLESRIRGRFDLIAQRSNLMKSAQTDPTFATIRNDSRFRDLFDQSA